MTSSLRCLDLVELRGQQVPRWAAEKTGLVPVTITRCPRAFEGHRAQLLLYDWLLKDLFNPGEFMRPARDFWEGSLWIDDNAGKRCLAFWPQTWKVRSV